MLARLMLGVLLLVQAIHLAQACLVPFDRPAMAFAQGEPCKMPMGAVHDNPITPNACLSQCLQGDQSSGGYELALPSLSDAVIFIVPLSRDAQFGRGFPTTESNAKHDPPPLVRFCSLLL
jgi:hypothetical protein